MQKFKTPGRMADHSLFFCTLCKKDCYLRSKFDRHLRGASHKLQANIQKITLDSRKRTSGPSITLEPASGSAAGGVDEIAIDGQVLVGIRTRGTCIYSSDPLNINSG